VTSFLRLLADKDKASNLLASCSALRNGESDERVFQVTPDSFRAVPGSPFSYWVSRDVREKFNQFGSFEFDGRFVKHGLTTGTDDRFLRAWWEIKNNNGWLPFAKGGNHSPYYADQKLVLNWGDEGCELRAGYETKAIAGTRLDGNEYFGRSGLTWPLRSRRFSPQALARASSFSARGYCAFFPEGEELAGLALFNSQAFDYFFKIALGRFGFPEFIVGILQVLPWPSIGTAQATRLASLSRRAWSLKRTLDTIDETSHAFALPAALRTRLGDYGPPAIEAEVTRIQAEIDAIAFDLYCFSEADRAAVLDSQVEGNEVEVEATKVDDNDDEDSAALIDQTVDLLSWAIGVAFGRFDWRLATGERVAPSEPDPFDPLPAKSPGMLPHNATTFHSHAGILVDDPGHAHDLARLVEGVLTRVDVPAPGDLCHWLQKDFFPFHLQRYSKSRRKAPIYWPLSTLSGSYTLWVYYPSLTSQTLYTAINDFVEPKLRQVGVDMSSLRNKGSARSRDDEKQFELLQALEAELLELREKLQEIAPCYKPNQNDGVQITAAPLWSLFRHKPWQKVLKDTWVKLENGDYDWAHLAMAYWPDRVREKCKTDKSLAIAHGLEELYVEPEAAPKKTRGRKKADS
jgi:hypothetical protein